MVVQQLNSGEMAEQLASEEEMAVQQMRDAEMAELLLTGEMVAQQVNAGHWAAFLLTYTHSERRQVSSLHKQK